jgi:hypothetical protein
VRHAARGWRGIKSAGRWSSAAVACAGCVWIGGSLGGCAAKEGGERAAEVTRGPAPDYAATAAKFNERVSRLGRVWGRATVQIRFTDEGGARRWEQGEGHITLERPTRVALSVGKLGETLFWLGCDAQRYWWMDLSGKSRVASVGRHDGPARRAGAGDGDGGVVGGLAATISPRDLFVLAGIEPLPVDGGGRTMWSADGRSLGVMTAWGGGGGAGGTRTMWLNPTTLEPERVELAVGGRVVLSSKLREYEPVEQIGDSRIRPQVPGRVFITHAGSGAELRLYLSGLENDPKRFAAAAFEFEALTKFLRVESVVDLDREAERGRGRAVGGAAVSGGRKP